MAQKKSDDTSDSFGQTASRLHWGDASEIDTAGIPGLYSYRLVHTQKSVWVLDLRLDFSRPCDISDIGDLLGALGRHIVGTAVLDHLSDEVQRCVGNDVSGGGINK